ncbi:hypothetical protein [Mucilaginibacter pedocola]|nr:hypothetical protein [Mucilaginibacter pedocola]
MNKILFILFTLAVSVNNLYGQNKTIRGRVISDLYETEPAVLIIVDDTLEVGKTDLNGFFKITIPVSVKKILFFSLGVEPAIIELSDNCNEVEVVMLASYTYDFQSPKKINRIRMRRFDQLPKIHKQAFEKGLFKTDNSCYTQEFKPFFKKKQE